jgi:tripartite-type tricarboxylate transporter receptor subunit TctC
MRITTASACATLLLAPLTAFGQTYPARTITVVVPSVAGGPTDIVGRTVAQMLSENIGQNAVVDNRAGAGNTLGAEYTARAKPDGYTLTIASPSSHSIAPAIYPKLPYDPIKDFTPVMLLATAPLLLVSHPALPVKNVKDLIALAKARPGQLNYGSGGSGTTGHLTAEYFKTTAGIKAVHIPYKGVAPATVDLLSGQLQYMFHIMNIGVIYVNSKQLRGLAITSGKRSNLVPDVPTMDEAGVAGFEVYTWYGLVGPAGLNKDVVEKLYTTMSKALPQPENRKRFETQGLDVVGARPEDLGKLMREETTRWAKVVKDSGAKVD